MGLINRTYPADPKVTYGAKSSKTQWQRFENQVAKLNFNSPPNVQYKVLYLGRHGEGYHNAAESFYGTPAWNCYWAEQNGNATASWDDARLTPNGIAQAQIANAFWANAIRVQKIPTPESFYTSPLTRCLATANITFSGLNLPPRFQFVPEVKELLREGISIHTCDRRGTASYIRKSFPSYKFEQGFNEFDILWRGCTGESSTAQNARSKTVLDDLFSNDESTYLSITSHSGEIASILSVLGHRPFSLSTGAVIPVLVKAEIVAGDAPTTVVSTWQGLNTCTGSATSVVTSLASATGTNGCVCGVPSATKSSVPAKATA